MTEKKNDELPSWLVLAVLLIFTGFVLIAVAVFLMFT